MGSAEAYEQIIRQVCVMDRETVTDHLLHFTGDLPLDFSEDYLTSRTTEQMQHLLAAAMWRCYVRQLATGVAAGA